LNYLFSWEPVEGKGNFVQDSGAIPIKIDLLFYPTSAPIKQIGKQGRPVATPRLEAVLELSSTTCHSLHPHASFSKWWNGMIHYVENGGSNFQ
jgi:hypothetical protein